MLVRRVHMTEIRTMEIRLYPNKTQERTMLDTLGIAVSFTTISSNIAGMPSRKASDILPNTI